MRLPRTLPRSVVAAVLSAAVSSAWVPVAAAQPAVSEDDKRMAKELANQGYEHYEAGDLAKAIELFHLAEKRYPAPTILQIEARAYEKSGGLVEAQGLYQRIAGQELAADAPKEFVDAQDDAKAALDRLKGRIAFVKIVLKGMTADRVRITIDDVEVPEKRVLEPIPQNPGTHKVVAIIGGDDTGRSVFQSVTLKEGVTKQIQLVFRPGGSITAGELPPSGGGCASCEVGAPSGGAEFPTGMLGVAVVGVVAAARRLRRRRSAVR